MSMLLTLSTQSPLFFIHKWYLQNGVIPTCYFFPVFFTYVGSYFITIVDAMIIIIVIIVMIMHFLSVK